LDSSPVSSTGQAFRWNDIVRHFYHGHVVGFKGKKMRRVELEKLSRETLIELARMYSRNWLTLDGAWFGSVEKHFGLAAAEQLDLENWQKQAVIEAKRIKKIMKLNGGSLSDILTVLSLMSWQLASEPFKLAFESPDKVVLYWDKCAVQEGRNKQNKAVFACKSMKHSLLSSIAHVVAPGAVVTCHFAPPDKSAPDRWCEWEISLSA